VFRRRLLELGFVPGTPVLRCEGTPGGDPLAYLVRGAVLALRRSDARHIQVEGQ
jgi:ferrous iron transport protein A